MGHLKKSFTQIFEDLKEKIINYNNNFENTDLQKETFTSYAFVGDNSTGKSYAIEYIADTIFKNNKINLIYIPKNRQGLDIELVNSSHENNGLSFDKYIPSKLGDLSEILNERLYSNQIEDAEKSIIATMLRNIYAHPFSHPLITFFKNRLNFELFFKNYDDIHISLNNEHNFSPLTSSGYQEIIRVTSEIFFSLEQIVRNKKNSETIIFIDEPDSSLYWNKSEIFFKELFSFILDNFSIELKIKFVISTHTPETIATLPENMTIIKFIKDISGNIAYKEYYSNDFLTLEQVEKIIFNKNESYIKESENLKKLKEIYYNCLNCSRCKSRNCEYLEYSDNFTYSNLSTKEKIIYNAIEHLQRR